MKTYGLIGFPLGHSFSQKFFSEKFDRERIANCEYRLFAIDSIERLPELLQSMPDLCGFNVTIPYKEQVIKYLDRVDDEAARIGAVNCVKIENGELTGHNTDAYGFRESLLNLIGEERPRALVLGTGGASKAIRYVLEQLGIEFKIVSRTATSDYIGYEDVNAEIVSEYKLIVNTTPVGTYPNADAAPQLPYELMDSDNFLYDLVYNPPLTRFLSLGAERGAKTMNGAQMLEGQALKSWDIWNS